MKADEKRSCYTCHRLQTCPHYSVGSVIIPNAPRDDANNPYPCAKDCGYSKPPYCERTPIKCDNCWRRPLEEVE